MPVLPRTNTAASPAKPTPRATSWWSAAKSRLRPDAKSQVSVQYIEDQPVRITHVVVSTQHAHDASHKTIKEFVIEEVIKKVLPGDLLDKKTKYLINPTGRFVVGGPQGDTGLT